MVKAIAESQLLRADEASPHIRSWPKADIAWGDPKCRFGPIAPFNPTSFAFTGFLKAPQRTAPLAGISFVIGQPPLPLLRLDERRCSRADAGDLHDDLFVLGTVEVYRLRRMLHVAPRF